MIDKKNTREGRTFTGRPVKWYYTPLMQAMEKRRQELEQPQHTCDTPEKQVKYVVLDDDVN